MPKTIGSPPPSVTDIAGGNDAGHEPSQDQTKGSDPVYPLLFSSLAWNVGVSNDGALTTSRHYLNLSLFDAATDRLLAESTGSLDNTQNLYMKLFAGHRYELRVTSGTAGNFSQDYALAWRMEVAAVPLPAAVWFFGSGVVGLIGLARGRMSAKLTAPGSLARAGCGLDRLNRRVHIRQQKKHKPVFASHGQSFR